MKLMKHFKSCSKTFIKEILSIRATVHIFVLSVNMEICQKNRRPMKKTTHLQCALVSQVVIFMRLCKLFGKN